MIFPSYVHWMMDSQGVFLSNNPFLEIKKTNVWFDLLAEDELTTFKNLANDLTHFPRSFSMEFSIPMENSSIAFFHGKFVRTNNSGAEDDTFNCHALEIEPGTLSTSGLTSRLKTVEEATREKTSFLANMSHEIRTPVQSILGYAHILAEDSLSTEDRKKMASAMGKSGEFLLELIKDILDFSKIEAGKIDIHRQPCSPWFTLCGVFETLEIQAHTKGLKLVGIPHGKIPAVIRTDITKVRQILVNLISNAIKYTPKGDIEVHLKVVTFGERDNNFLVFEVIDHGPGMTDNQIKDLFKPFIRVGRGARARTEGTGLGLTIANKLANLLGGVIQVNAMEHQGSAFSFFLPLENKDMNKTEEPSRLVSSSYKPSSNITSTLSIPNSANILLVEDSEDIQIYLKYVLEKEGFDVTITSDGQKALEEIQAQEFDLVLMDIQMPILDGIQTTQILRKTGYSIPIIALTANATSEDEKLCFEKGFSAYLTKPVDREKLLEVLAIHLTLNPKGDFSSFRQQEEIPMELVREFLNTANTKLERISDYFKSKDYPGIQKEAHQLSGAGGLYGFSEVTNIAKRLEYAAKSITNTEIIHDLIKELRSELDK